VPSFYSATRLQIAPLFTHPHRALTGLPQSLVRDTINWSPLTGLEADRITDMDGLGGEGNLVASRQHHRGILSTVRDGADGIACSIACERIADDPCKCPCLTQVVAPAIDGYLYAPIQSISSLKGPSCFSDIISVI